MSQANKEGVRYIVRLYLVYSKMDEGRIAFFERVYFTFFLGNTLQRKQNHVATTPFFKL